MTIEARAEPKSLSLKRNDEKNEVILEIEGKKIYYFTLKTENNSLNIYNSPILDIEPEYYDYADEEYLPSEIVEDSLMFRVG
ncbi:MAG TPA: hypothetical protein PLM24_02520 [Methanothrix sp.]|nr:hypothetical protein [Methanothrix sp.]HPJ84793.1 hypothetical protein [Methanothrix sp.]HPR65994.1 hypothetical protein [Methanothrix sp.]